ncbi:class I SAM-dependent methyltransferase [Paraburkholderia diazotrophica]|uniref:class I SAM-dependent methyltransferase n=1 Tax=Paraburkholderia diazotrophica TaxID=667676 RepID=UPI003178B9BA
MGDIPLGKSTMLDAMCSRELAPLFWRPVRLGITSAWWEHVPFAHWLVASIRPRSIVELGTHNGVSYSAFCEAVVREGLDTQCSAVDTWLGDEHAGRYSEGVYAELRTFHDSRYGSFSTLVRSTFDEALGYFPDCSIDLLHIDGLHTYDAVRHDFESWLPKLTDRAVVLFHDINVRANDFGVWKVWSELQERYPSFTFTHGHGLGVLAVGKAVPAAARQLCSIDDDSRVNSIRERFALVGERWNVEFRDAQRVAEIGRLALMVDDLNAQMQGRIAHADQLERALKEVNAIEANRTEEAASLRTQLAEVEAARKTLHDALQEQTERGDALAARVDELKAWGDDLLATNQTLRAELVDLRRAPERTDIQELRQELEQHKKQQDALHAEISGLRGRSRLG